MYNQSLKTIIATLEDLKFNRAEYCRLLDKTKLLEPTMNLFTLLIKERHSKVKSVQINDSYQICVVPCSPQVLITTEDVIEEYLHDMINMYWVSSLESTVESIDKCNVMDYCIKMIEDIDLTVESILIQYN